MLPSYRMLFIRNFLKYRGGHQKVFDYFTHVADSRLFEPVVYFTPNSVLDSSNPWIAAGIQSEPAICDADCYFLAGMDWDWVDNAGIDLTGKPVINLIQGFGWADPKNIGYRQLVRPATRICVSDELAQALNATQAVNGAVYSIPNGVPLADLAPLAATPRAHDVFVAGFKNPHIATEIAAELRTHDLDVDLATALIPKAEFLSRLSQARVAVLIPHPNEGFGLFAIEAMTVQTAVVIPDCLGNRSFCRHEETCLVPAYQNPAMAAAALRLCREGDLRQRLIDRAMHEVEFYNLDRERRAFMPILESVAASARHNPAIATG